MTEENKTEKKTIKIKPVEYAIFCDYASVQANGKLNLDGIFDRIMTQEFPLVHSQLYVVTKMILPKGEHKVTLSIHQEDKVLAKSTLEKDVKRDIEPHTHFWNLKSLKIEDDKLVEFQVYIDGQQVYVKRLPVIKVEPKQKA